MTQSTAPTPSESNIDRIRARYETLLEVAEAISAHRQLATLFADLSRLLKRLVSFDFISLTLVDQKERVVRLHILESDYPVVGKTNIGTPFDQTPSDQQLPPMSSRAIQVVNVPRFPLQIERFGSLGLHAIGEFKRLDSGFEQRGLPAFCSVKVVESLDEIQLPTLFFQRQTRIADIGN